MTQLLTIVALLAVGYLLYRSLVVKRVAPKQDNVTKPADEPTPVESGKPPVSGVKPAPATIADTSAAKTPADSSADVAPAETPAALVEPSLDVPPQPDPAVAAAAASGYAAQVALLENTTDPVARHRLLQQIVEICYRERADATAQADLARYAQQHINEFGQIEGPLKKQNGGKLPQVHTFKHYAALLTEQGQYDDAIVVCEKAIALGLKDGTKTGYQGRLERIKAKQDSA